MTPNDCGHTHLAAAWVLGTLTSTEAQQFSEHLAVCGTCQAEVASLQDAADAMADAVSPVQPRAGFSARLMSAVRKEAELFRAAAASDPDPVNARRPRRRLLLSTLLVLAAAGLVLGGTILSGVLAADPEEHRVESRTISGIVTTDGCPDARAAILVRGEDTKLVLTDVSGPPDGRIYQAWLVRPPSMPVPTGALFSIGATGDTTISLPAISDAQQLIVTSEPPRGSTVPTLPPVVVVHLPVSG